MERWGWRQRGVPLLLGLLLGTGSMPGLFAVTALAAPAAAGTTASQQVVTPVSAAAAVDAVQRKKEQQEALFLTAAVVSLASYGDDRSLLAREWLRESGWSIASHETVSPVAEGRFHLVRKELAEGKQAMILSFPGTERKKDVEVDLKTHRVPFGGTNPQEFAAAAAGGMRQEAPLPMVHKGFDDYTMTALFTTPVEALQGQTAGEALAAELLARPQEILCLTGHSLGGAAATLAAARLSDMGVPKEQLRVITFGAPAVGDEAFARRYESRFALTRVVMEGDPVAAVLQSLSGHFVQFGEKVRWRQNRNSDRFAHQMVVYLDDALRSYYDETPEGTITPLTAHEPKALSGGLYVVGPELQLDAHLTDDAAYMRRSLTESLALQYAPVVFAPPSQQAASDLPSLMAAARQAGCQSVLLTHLRAEGSRTQEGVYRLSLVEELYDLQGHLLTMQSHSMTTRDMTPLEAASCLQFLGREERDRALGLS